MSRPPRTHHLPAPRAVVGGLERLVAAVLGLLLLVASAAPALGQQATRRPQASAAQAKEDSSGPLRVFDKPPAPAAASQPAPAQAQEDLAYRRDAARHLYNLYGPSIFRGRMPPLLYSVMVVETLVDADGAVVSVDVVRKPAAAEVEPWVTAMIRQAAPFPAPARLPGGQARYVEIWLVDKSGRFQLDTLTEGQR